MEMGVKILLLLLKFLKSSHTGSYRFFIFDISSVFILISLQIYSVENMSLYILRKLLREYPLTIIKLDVFNITMILNFLFY